MSWRIAVKVSGEPNWSYNAQRFATKEEAQMAGDDLFSRWPAVESYEPQESTDPVNYRLEAGQMTRIEEPTTTSDASAVGEIPLDITTMTEALPEEAAPVIESAPVEPSPRKRPPKKKSNRGKFADGSSMKGLFDTKDLFIKKRK
jgi:hypothetical protein